MVIMGEVVSLVMVVSIVTMVVLLVSFLDFGRGGGRKFIICQICFKHTHSAAECRDGFNRNFVPNLPVNGHYLNQNQSSKAAYMATSEGIADQGWYLDSGATHHLTNNV